MDYIALNHTHGVIYNSEKPIGGIRYYRPKNKNVETDKKTGLTTVAINLPKPKKISPKNEKSREELEKDFEADIAKKEKLISERLKELEEKFPEQKFQAQDLETSAENFEKEIKKKEKLLNKKAKAQRKTNKKEEKRLKREAREAARNKDYIVYIKDKKVNFTKEGIKKAHLSRAERRWLAKAQNYFITAEEKGRKIGSAQEFTSWEILESLWSTAEDVGIDPKRFIVQIYNESRFNPYVRGRAGERGIGQFKKSTAKYYNYDWSKMVDGIDGFAYQAKAAADFVKAIGEVAYNSKSKHGEKYRDRISMRVGKIHNNSDACVMKNVTFCRT